MKKLTLFLCTIQINLVFEIMEFWKFTVISISLKMISTTNKLFSNWVTPFFTIIIAAMTLHVSNWLHTSYYYILNVLQCFVYLHIRRFQRDIRKILSACDNNYVTHMFLMTNNFITINIKVTIKSQQNKIYFIHYK